MSAARPRPASPRVLMLTSSYLPRVGGVERHVRCVVRELSGRGFEIRVATPRWDDAWPARERVEGVEVTRLSLDSRVGRRELAPLVAWATLVHTHDAYPFLKYYFPFRFVRPRLPVFVTFHGYEGYPVPLEARVLRRLVLWLTRGNVCAGAFIPKWYRFRCDHITHGGVDTPGKRPTQGEGAVFLGRLEPDTGFLSYLEALRVLKEEHGIELPLSVCGGGSQQGQAEAFVREHGLAVEFHGTVEDVMPYLLRARFACVSGFLGILEAMAAGAIVLALYDSPLKKDYLRLFPGAEHIVITASPAELADRVAELARSPERVDAMAERAFEFARRQTWAHVADLYVDLWTSRGGLAP